MNTREIPREDWKEFFDGFVRRHEGWLVDVEVLGRLGAQKEASQLPLEDISSDPHARTITITVGPENRITHVVERPVKVEVEEDQGAEVALQIRSETGDATLLTFRSAVATEMVDGILGR